MNMTDIDVQSRKLLKRDVAVDKTMYVRKHNYRVKNKVLEGNTTCDVTALSQTCDQKMSSANPTAWDRQDGIPSLDLRLSDGSVKMRKMICEKSMRSKTPELQERSIVGLPLPDRPASTGRKLPPIRHQQMMTSSNKLEKKEDNVSLSSQPLSGQRRFMPKCVIGENHLTVSKTVASASYLPKAMNLQGDSISPVAPASDRLRNFPSRSATSVKQRKLLKEADPRRLLSPTPPTASQEKPKVSSTILSVRSLQITEDNTRSENSRQPTRQSHPPRNRPQNIRTVLPNRNRDMLVRNTHPPFPVRSDNLNSEVTIKTRQDK